MVLPYQGDITGRAPPSYGCSAWPSWGRSKAAGPTTVVGETPPCFARLKTYGLIPGFMLCPSSQLQTCKSTLPLTWELPCSPHRLLQGLLSPHFPHKVGNPCKASSLSAPSAEEGDHLQLSPSLDHRLTADIGREEEKPSKVAGPGFL